MPTYEYRCKNCGSRFEVFQAMSDKPSADCPRCGRPAGRMISSGAGIVTRGRNFRHSDERRNNLSSGRTCCGRTQRCDSSPCSDDGTCKR